MMPVKRDLLKLAPVRKTQLQLEQEAGMCFVRLPRTTLLERFVIKWFHQPTHRTVRLDQLGSFVLQRCDGRHCVAQLAEQIEAKFGAQAAPVLERLLAFLTILETNDWIEWQEIVY